MEYPDENVKRFVPITKQIEIGRAVIDLDVTLVDGNNNSNYSIL